MRDIITIAVVIFLAFVLDYLFSMALYFFAKRMAREQDYYFQKNGRSWQWNFKLDATKNSKGEIK